MKIVKNVLLALVALIVIVLVLVAIVPSNFEVERDGVAGRDLVHRCGVIDVLGEVAVGAEHLKRILRLDHIIELVEHVGHALEHVGGIHALRSNRLRVRRGQRQRAVAAAATRGHQARQGHRRVATNFLDTCHRRLLRPARASSSPSLIGGIGAQWIDAILSTSSPGALVPLWDVTRRGR